MSRWSRALALMSLVALSACGWTERTGEFTYVCRSAIHPLDGPSCNHQLTDRYLLRYGEGSGDHIVLAYAPDDTGSGALISQLGGDDLVQLIGLDEHLLVVQSQSGRIYVAPAHPEGWPKIVGPLTEEEFATRFPDAPPWKLVQP